MCGFSGIFSFDGINNNHLSVVKQMTEEIKHRGPDETDFFKDNFLSLGFNRLSIIDIDNGKQPMMSANKRFIVSMNGEIYNYKKLKEELISNGTVFKTSSDTEVFLELFSKYQFDCLNKLRGMYAIVIYDILKKKIYLIRDRYGIKPLFYAISQNCIIFSSEISPLINSGLVNAEPNYNALSSYLSFRYNYGVGEYFKNIKSINPGNYLIFSNQEYKCKEYWRIPAFKRENQNKTSENNIIEELDQVIMDSVNNHMVSDVPISSLLSGGLDSSLISAIMRINLKKKFNSFSAVFDENGYDESKFAEDLAEKIDLQHTIISLKPEDYEKKISDYIGLKKTPLSIPHEIALFSLFKNIQKKTKVVLSGEGADEIFGGYGRVQSSAFDYKKKLYISNFFKNKPEDISSFFLDKYSWVSFDQKQKIFTNSFYNSINFDTEIKQFWKNEFYKIKEIDPYDQFLLIFQKYHLTCLLDRLDYTSMASGVEARTPFVDHKVIEFANSIPYELKFKWKSRLHKFVGIFRNSFKNSENLDTSKYILRKMAEKYIPTKFTNKKKLGFPVPLDIWMNKKMKHFAKSILLDQTTKSRQIFNLIEIEKIINNPEKIDHDFWGKKIWMMINIELWFRKAIDKK